MSCRGPAPNPSSEIEKEATRTLLITKILSVDSHRGAPRLAVFMNSWDLDPPSFPQNSRATQGIIQRPRSLLS
jgi:hypothetical protein